MTQSRSHIRRQLGVAAAAACIVLVATACSAGSTASDAGAPAPVQLRFTTFVPDDNPHGLTAKWFMDEVTKRTDGRVTFDASWLEASCPAAEQYQCVTDGRADIALGAPTYEPQKFPISLIAPIQYLGESNDHKARAFEVFYEQHDAVQQEYASQDLELLGLWTTRLMLGGSGEAYVEPADMVGKNIRSVGGPASTSLSLIGANPIAITANEVYEALQRGVVDGYEFPLEAIVQYSLYDHSDFFVDPLAGAFGVLNMVINKDVLASLDTEARAAIEDVTAELTGHAVQQLADVTTAACDKLVELTEGPDGKEFVVWSQNAADQWSDEIAETLRADWERSAGENGVEDPSDVFDSWISALDEIEEPAQDAELACAERF